MPFTGIADPEAVSKLWEVVDRHCRNNNITDDLEREQVASRVVSLFNRGMTDVDDLMSVLANEDSRSMG